MTNDADSKDKTPDTNKDSERERASELASFLRGVGVRALDHLAARIVEKSSTRKKQPKPIRKIAEHWSDMNIAQKERFFEQVISAAQVLAVAAPALIAGAAARKAGKKAKELALAKESAKPEPKPKKKEKKAKELAPAKESAKPETKKKAKKEKGKKKSEAKDSKAKKPKKS